MEKVVVATGNYPLSNEDMYEVNQYLARGWVVKSVTTQNTKDHMTVIFVLEGDLMLGMAGMYKSQTGGWRNDYLTLKENGTYDSSFGTKGIWKIEGESVILVPDNGWLPTTCSIRADGECVVIGDKVFNKY